MRIADCGLRIADCGFGKDKTKEVGLMECDSIQIGGKYLWKGHDEKEESFCREIEVIDKGLEHSSGRGFEGRLQPYRCRLTVKLKSGEILEINSRELDPLQGSPD